MEFRRLDLMSVGKLFAVLYAILGLLAGLGIALISVAGMSLGAGAGLGVLSIIVLPIIYGIIGFIAGILTALFYNIAASLVGGIEVETK